MGKALIGQELTDLEALLAARGEARFRARQLYRGLYRERCDLLAELTALPAALRESLTAEYEPGWLPAAERVVSTDGTVRYLLSLADGKTVEAVYLPERDRDTLCISSQVGCPVDCQFCLTAQLGLERNLTAGEIVGQVLTLCREHGLEPRERPLNLVLMGMGEPLLNLDQVMKAVRLLSDAEGIAIPLRRITVSTSGIVPKIDEMAQHEIRPKLAISLNAPTQELRERIMPITRKWTLELLLDACRRYPLRPWERLTFEYVLLRGVNDSPADARQVVRLLAGLRAKVNLIGLNPGPGIPFETPEPERVAEFQQIIRRSLPCFVRKPRGREIYAACGQLKRTVA